MERPEEVEDIVLRHGRFAEGTISEKYAPRLRDNHLVFPFGRGQVPLYLVPLLAAYMDKRDLIPWYNKGAWLQICPTFFIARFQGSYVMFNKKDGYQSGWSLDTSEFSWDVLLKDLKKKLK